MALAASRCSTSRGRRLLTDSRRWPCESGCLLTGTVCAFAHSPVFLSPAPGRGFRAERGRDTHIRKKLCQHREMPHPPEFKALGGTREHSRRALLSFKSHEGESTRASFTHGWRRSGSVTESLMRGADSPSDRIFPCRDPAYASITWRRFVPTSLLSGHLPPESRGKTELRLQLQRPLTDSDAACLPLRRPETSSRPPGASLRRASRAVALLVASQAPPLPVLALAARVARQGPGRIPVSGRCLTTRTSPVPSSDT